MKAIRLRLDEHIEKGNEGAIVELLNKLDSKVVLAPELEEKLKKIGNTPILEEARYKKIQDKDENGLIAIVEDLITREEVKNFKAEEIGDFIHAVIEKVSSHKDENGDYKSTENTKDCDMPDAFAVEDLLKMLEKVEKSRQKIADPDIKDKDKDKVMKKFVKDSEELSDMVFDVVGLKKEDLTVWEQMLVANMTFSTVRGYRNHAQGKHSQS